MNEILELVLIAFVAVTTSTLIYKVVPFKIWGVSKPRFSLFPKYIAKFDKTVEEIEDLLVKLEFKKNDNGLFSRGKVYGDFSTKAMKLTVFIDKEANEIKVYASFFGILFDTGDVWQLTSDIVNG